MNRPATIENLRQLETQAGHILRFKEGVQIPTHDKRLKEGMTFVFFGWEGDQPTFDLIDRHDNLIEGGWEVVVGPSILELLEITNEIDDHYV